jgi:uncharacterized membrane protein
LVSTGDGTHALNREEIEMAEEDGPLEAGVTSVLRYRHDTPEFARVVNLSDGVFAIALTLLVLTVDVPGVPAEQLARALLDEASQVLIFGLSFLLIANIWWFHHKLVAQLAAFDAGLVAINLAFLGLIALVPFPTSLVGASPTARAAVLPLITVFLAISVLFVVIILWAHHVQAWRQPPPQGVFPWLLGGWVGQIAGMSIAITVAVWVPLAGLVVAAATGWIVGFLLGVFAPSAYRQWRGRPGL